MPRSGEVNSSSEIRGSIHPEENMQKKVILPDARIHLFTQQCVR